MDETVYKVEKIVDHKFDRDEELDESREYYKVQWKGFEGTDDYETWEPIEGLENAQDAIWAYHRETESMEGNEQQARAISNAAIRRYEWTPFRPNHHNSWDLIWQMSPLYQGPGYYLPSDQGDTSMDED